MLHFGYYKPRLAALSILRQPSSGCLWLKWKHFEDGEWMREEEKWTTTKWKLRRRRHHSLVAHVPQLLRKHSALLPLHVHNKSEHHHHNRHRCWSRASEQLRPEELSSTVLWLELNQHTDWSAYRIGATSRVFHPVIYQKFDYRIYMFSATNGLSFNMWLLSIEYEHKYNPTKCLLLNISGRLVTLYQQGAKP